VVTGVVQGVGFRPFVYQLATELALTGFVGNDDDGVFIEVEGPDARVAEFVERLTASPPPIAHIAGVSSTPAAPLGGSGFSIVPSRAGSGGSALVSPDLRTCDACLAELRDPNDRRHAHPFVNCTDCGPRYTITKATPYDRPNTTMAGFVMCDRCRAEYEDPRDRRFHAQPIACPECGPQVRLERHGTDAGTGSVGADAIAETRRLVAGGAIVAVKGIGGFHLACDALSDVAVSRLRDRKGRRRKPFALMVADLATARSIADFDDAEERALTSDERPIVLVRQRAGSAVSPHVAPGQGHLGLMLPYTPLHHLLVGSGDVWVMTSANRAQEPIAHTDEQARALGDLADAILLHDREIHVPVDDSVVRVVDGSISPIRRSRGFAPFPVDLPITVPPILATGGELKATLCLAAGTAAFLSQHLGDMENVETLEAFSRAAEHLQALFRIRPEVLATDLHPQYLSARWADCVADGRPVIRVQHHHAHVASVAAEHGVTDPVIGFAFDGTGYGPDGTIWGGEVLVADLRGFERALHLRPVPLPGGDAAVRHPHRMALAHLHAAGLPWDAAAAPLGACAAHEPDVLRAQLERGLHTVPTSSMGRLFDAISSLAGVSQLATYEGEAAIELEAVADTTERGSYEFGIDGDLIDPTPVLAAVLADLSGARSAAIVSARFHAAVTRLIVSCAERVRRDTGIGTVALSGGVFQNVTLASAARRELTRCGFRVLVHHLVPANDGGLALGQAVIAATKVS